MPPNQPLEATGVSARDWPWSFRFAPSVLAGASADSLADFAHMTTIIAFFLIVLAAAIIIPTLPSSRRVRLVLAVVAVPVVVLAYQRIEVYASYIGATHMDVFIDHSERLLKEGKTEILLEAYQDYREQHGGRIPKSSAAAYRALLLENLVKQKELEKDTHP